MPVYSSPSCRFIRAAAICPSWVRAFLLAIFLVFSRHFYYVSFQDYFRFIVFLFLFSGLACVVVFSYPVRAQIASLAHEFAFFFVFGFPLSHSL